MMPFCRLREAGLPEPPGRENGYRFPLRGQEKPPDGIARPCEGGDGGLPVREEAAEGDARDRRLLKRQCGKRP